MIKAVVFDYGGVIRRHFIYQRRLVKYAAELRNRGYVTAVLSNLFAPQTIVAGLIKDHRGFDPVVISSQEKIRKPDEKIYRIMLERLGLKADECIFVDNKICNIEAARRLGFHVVHARGTAQVISELETLLK